jgi:hypothetical protein
MTSGNRISKNLYLWILFASIAAAFAPALLMRSGRSETATWALIAAGTVVLTAAMIILLAFWHQAWSAIQDGHARTTPARAVGFALIPIFNLYWIFQLVWGFAVDFNAYASRHEQDVPPLPEGLFLALPIVALATSLPLLGIPASLAVVVLYALVIIRVCDSVNALESSAG